MNTILISFRILKDINLVLKELSTFDVEKNLNFCVSNVDF